MSSMYINEPATKGKVCLQTTLGDIDIELWSQECPLACRNFVQLCMEGYYNKVVFHRLIKDFIVQTGDPTGTGHGGESIYDENFKSEFHQRLKFVRRGLLGMAGEKKDQNGSQFFFTLGPTPELNGKHTLFGKVVGNTLFNMLKLNEYEVDANQRPTYLHKILGAKILNNPFPDIVPRRTESSISRKKKHKSSKKDDASTSAKKNTGLLSFGDEVEEDEEEISLINKKIKSKSAHDCLDDSLLSREEAVKPNELEDYEAPEQLNVEEKKNRMDRIREKLKGKKRVRIEENENDDDLEGIIDDQKEAEKKAELEKLSEELKSLQKEYKKSMRGPKETKIVNEEEKLTDGMKMYNKLKLKFKSSSKGVVKSIDPNRQQQTMDLLNRFKTKLQRTDVQGILMDKAVDMSDVKTKQQIIEEATSEEQGKMDLDAPDVEGEEWMNHALVAPEDTSGVTKAKDPNFRGEDADWYPIDDPRNIINKQRREGSLQID